jgi:transcriptional regulator with XRE-family HTH domain
VEPADIRQNLGQRIGELRQAKGLTQAALAKKCAVTFQFISQIEKGETTTNPTLDTLISIAAALNVEMRDLFEPPEGTYRRPRRGRPKKPTDP